MPLPKRRSSSSSSFRRTLLGRDCLPPPTTMGATNRWHSSTNPALIAWAASSGPPTRDVTFRLRFHLPDRFRVEVSLDPRPGAGHRLQRRGVHDLVGGLPYLREVLYEGQLVGEGVRGLPVDHHLVHPAPVEVGADRPLEVVDEGVHLLVRLSPVEVAVLVRDVAVERRDRRVDQLGHGERLPSLRRVDSERLDKPHQRLPDVGDRRVKLRRSLRLGGSRAAGQRSRPLRSARNASSADGATVEITVRR